MYPVICVFNEIVINIVDLRN